LEPLLDYCLYRSHDRSLTWMAKVTRSVRMFLEYLQTNPAERDTYRLFQNFAQRLYTGTFDRQTGLDPSGLCWAPRSPQDASHIITQLSDFFDWLGEMRPEAARLNPRYAGWCLRPANRRGCLPVPTQQGLPRPHLGSERIPRRDRASRARSTPAQGRQGGAASLPGRALRGTAGQGILAAGRRDYRGMLVTLLLHGAFRESEPFHLYIPDVFPDPTNPTAAKVFIHHPSYGAAPADWRDQRGRPRKGNRAEYLGHQFGLVPRTELMDRRHAGWKGGMHDGAYYKQAYWFLPEYGEWFLHLWHRYLEQVARVERNHPFAFINLNREPLGGMYSLSQFNKAHAAACERIGLTVSKALGTTPHGHRHGYGRRLRNAGIDKTLIRRFMHHASLESQEVYTQANTREALAALEAAAQRLRAGNHRDIRPQSDLFLPGIELNK
jgi:GNAT superfamily N-acetyltransferase